MHEACDVSMVQGEIIPLQLVAPAFQVHPVRAPQLADVVSALQGMALPEQFVVVQLHPLSD
jgi:hypothetical protein